MIKFIKALLNNDKTGVQYDIVDRGYYYVVRRTYANGVTKTDRLGSKRANSTIRTALGVAL